MNTLEVRLRLVKHDATELKELASKPRLVEEGAEAIVELSGRKFYALLHS